MKVENIQTVLGFDGFIIDRITFSEGFVKAFYRRDRRKSMRCPKCGRIMGKNRTITREVYDLPIGSALCVRVQIETAQGKCSACGASKNVHARRNRGKRDGDPKAPAFRQRALPVDESG